jgi:hypothetical protein
MSAMAKKLWVIFMQIRLPYRRAVTQPALAVLLLAGCGGDQLADVPATGAVAGYLCDPLSQSLAVGVRVSGQGPTSKVETTTDAVGYFHLAGLAGGDQVLEIDGMSFTDALSVTVAASKTTELPDPPCLDTNPGTLNGKICGVGNGIGGGAYWVDGARVFIVEGTDIYETFTNIRGEYVLEGVPPGPHTLQVEKGSYSASMEVVVVGGSASDVEPVCVGDNVRVGVITGRYDHMDEMMLDLGLRIRECVPADLEGCPAQLVSSGAISLFRGIDSSDYITELLMDPVRLGEFDVLFFDCGLADIYLGSSPPDVFKNVRDFVDGGGSIYVSDWAYEILRLGFPGTFDFQGDDQVRNAAKVGVMSPRNASDVPIPLLGDVVSVNLVEALETNRVQLIFNKGSWVVPATTQPPAVEVWVTGDVSINSGGGTTTLNDAPLLMRSPYGDGNIFFTTFHTSSEVSSTEEMIATLRYVIFEL